MPDVATIKSIGDLGIPIVCVIILAYVLLKREADNAAERKQRDETLAQLATANAAALGNNTAAMQKLADSTERSCDRLDGIEGALKDVDGKLGQNLRVSDRIEAKVNDIHAIVRGTKQ